MAENNFTGVIESLMKGMNTVLSTKTVVRAVDIVDNCPGFLWISG